MEVWRLAFVLLRVRKKPYHAAGVCLLLGFAAVLVIIRLLRRSLAPDFVDSSVVNLLGGSWPKDESEVTLLLNAAYEGADATVGQHLSAEEIAKASEHGTFQKTYGEFATGGVDVLLHELNVTSEDVFCDLGSGTGKVVMQAFLQNRPKEGIGIELSESRHELAQRARDRLFRFAPVVTSSPWNTLNYVHGDVLDSDLVLARCNKIFFCSTVWPPELLQKMERKFMSLVFHNKPVFIVSSRQLKAFGGVMQTNEYPGRVRFLRQRRVDTSWGASFIQVYVLNEE